MSLLIERAQVAAAVEDTEGTAQALAGANVLLVFNPKFTPGVERHKRNPGRASLSQMAPVSGKRQAKLEFDVELKGSGAAGTPPEFGTLLKACGMSETIDPDTSVTYAPASYGIPSLTLGLYEDGVLYKLWGARGDVKLDLDAGKPGMFHFSFIGADFSVTDVALLSSGVSYQPTSPPAFANANFSMGGYASVTEKLSLALKNTLALRPSVNTGSGHLSTAITNRDPGGSFDPEMVNVATEDFFGDWRSGTLNTLAAVVGSTAGNICTIGAPKCAYRDLPHGDRSGIRTLGADFDMTMNSGDDEWTLAFT